MKTNVKIFRLIMCLMLAITLIHYGCKKEAVGEEPPQSDLGLVGKWASATEITSQLIYKASYQYDADGSGRHLLLSISPLESKVLSDQAFQWSTKNNKKVLMAFQSGTNGEYGYEINGNKLTYTSENDMKSIYIKEIQ